MSLIRLVVAFVVALQVLFILGYVVLLLVRRDRAASRQRMNAYGSHPLENLASSRYWWRRAEASRLAGSVARLGDRELLGRLLDDAHPAVQSAATASLAPLVDAGMVAHLLDRLPDRPMAVRLQQFRLLRDAGPLTEAALLSRLTADAAPRRLKSWIALAETMGSAELFARVGVLHGNPDPLIRLSVARALRCHRDAESEEVLLIALRDHDWRVRAVAARSLGTLGNTAAVPRLAVGMRDVRWWVRFRCGLALAQLGAQGRQALDAARRDTDRYAGEMATMIGGLSADSVEELAEG